MKRRQHMSSFVGALLIAVGLPGCLTLKAEHDELAREVVKLRKELAENQTTLARAQELETQLGSKLEEVEDFLRRNQADLGLRVENLELETQELRGAAENADFLASAAKQELTELRGEFDQRLVTIEEKINEATSIPENKDELFAEAQRLLKDRKYPQARRLFRTYESRYNQDSRMPEVKFNIGLTYFSERDFKSAIGEFYRITQEYPKAEILPDALYYSGLAFAKLGQCESSIAYFEALRERKTRAPAEYKKRATEQIEILKKDKGEICLDRNKRRTG